VRKLAAVRGGVEGADVTRPVLGRDDQCEGLADGLARGVPEQQLCCPVPRRDLALGADGDDRICCGGQGLGGEAGIRRHAGLLNR
jgi:hypothetical protein